MSGVTTVSGVAAVNHVAEEHKPILGKGKGQQLTEEKNALDLQQLQKVVIFNLIELVDSSYFFNFRKIVH